MRLLLAILAGLLLSYATLWPGTVDGLQMVRRVAGLEDDRTA